MHGAKYLSNGVAVVGLHTVSPMAVIENLDEGWGMFAEASISAAAPRAETIPPQNLLLRALPPRDFERLLPLLHRVTLTPRRVLQHAGVPIENIYFIEDGLVSVLASADERTTVEVGLIGREGAAGTVAILGVTVSPLRYFVQIGGSALKLKVSDLARVMQDIPQLRTTLHNALHAALMQSAQSAACSLSHTLSQRLARWLLAAQDRSDRDTIPITQDLLARSLGVRRASVSEAFKPLERAGAFAKSRGLVKILDRTRLEQMACRCYRVVREPRDQAARAEKGRRPLYSLPALWALLEIELLAH